VDDDVPSAVPSELQHGRGRGQAGLLLARSIRGVLVTSMISAGVGSALNAGVSSAEPPAQLFPSY